jgi:hypothetical protein
MFVSGLLAVDLLAVALPAVDLLAVDILEVHILEVHILEVDILEVHILEVDILEVDILEVGTLVEVDIGLVLLAVVHIGIHLAVLVVELVVCTFFFRILETFCYFFYRLYDDYKIITEHRLMKLFSGVRAPRQIYVIIFYYSHTI